MFDNMTLDSDKVALNRSNQTAAHATYDRRKCYNILAIQCKYIFPNFMSFKNAT